LRLIPAISVDAAPAAVQPPHEKGRTMSALPPPRTPAYLYRNLADGKYTSTPVELELTDSSLRCVLAGYSRWVAKRLGLPDLKQNLQAGQSVTVFDIPRHQMQIKWPVLFMGVVFQVTDGNGNRWTVSLTRPHGTTMAGASAEMIDMVGDRKARKQWREALDAVRQ
jgi:hypothetical protein